MWITGVEIGQSYKFAKTVSETDMVLFAGLMGDFSDTHINLAVHAGNVQYWNPHCPRCVDY